MTSWTFPRASKQYSAYARVQICKACGGAFVPPGHAGCCSARCVRYLEVAREPVLGDPLFGPQQPMACRGCDLRFESRGLVLCVDCYFKARPDVRSVAPPDPVEPDPQPAKTSDPRHDEPITDKDPRSRFCNW